MPPQSRTRKTEPPTDAEQRAPYAKKPVAKKHNKGTTDLSTATEDTSISTLQLSPATERSNATHIFFWGGVLSNWCTTTRFPGSRCLEILISELARTPDITIPSLDSFAGRLVKDHSFNCGEQWMMAVKAWLFESSQFELANWVIDGSTDKHRDEQLFQRLKLAMYETECSMPPESKEKLMWESTLCQILRQKNPRQQKALGRRAQGFNADVWSAINMPCVMAACVARAEVDPVLRRIYLASGDRSFVEGSPRDTIWGVGIHWKSVEIEDPAMWQGENRLGKCHDVAAMMIRQKS